jgi:hypothetical protein
MPPVLRPCLLLALVGCVPLGGGQDGGGCPEIACGPAYQVTFTRPGPWAAGSYRVEVIADGVGNSCDIVIPMSCDHPPRCQGSPSWLPALVGCALDPGQQRIDGVIFDRATPASVTVSVWQGDRALGMRTFMPSYRTSPGPVGCTFTCTQATGEAMTLTQ